MINENEITDLNGCSPATVGWLAGFMDGEGAIGLCRERDARKGPNYYYYRPMVQAVNTSPDPIMFLCGLLPSGRFQYVPRPSPQQDAYHFMLRSGPMALAFLLAIRPYLRIKQKQADLLIQYLRRRTASKGRGRRNAYTEEDHWIYSSLRILNLRGAEARKGRDIYV